MKKVLMSLSCVAIFSVAALSAQADTGQGKESFHSKNNNALACSDMTAVPEASDYILHDPTNPNLLTVMTQGRCSPISPNVKFEVIQQYTWQIPAGPQQLVQISIPMIDSPSMPNDIEWMMKSDVISVK